MIEVAFVLSVMANIPAECSLYVGQKESYCKPGTLGQYERGKDTREIAEAIARVATNRRDAIEMSVYAAYESQNRLDALGDKGLSHGPWQTPFVRASAEGYLADWIGLRQRSVANCANNSPDTKLAQLASGWCNRGTQTVSKRYGVIEALLEKVSSHP
jgi:hypothetical protein